MNQKRKTEAPQIPAFRFSGFSGEWENIFLKEYIDIQNGYAFKSQNFVENKTGIIVVTPGSVSIGGGYQANKGRNYCLNAEIPEKFIFKPGELFITLTDLTPSAQALGYPAIVPKNNNLYLHNQRLGKIIDNKIDKQFIYNLLQRSHYHRYVVSTASGTTVKHTSISSILNYRTFIPERKEQTQIGEFFQTMDRLIELQSEKVAQAERYKKAVLQKMFPQKGETIPKLRFAGFSEEWEEKRLKEVISSEFKGKAQASKLKSGDVEYLDAERLNGGMPYLSNAELDVDYDDILILWDGSKAGTVYKGFQGALGSTLKAYKIMKEHSSEFIYQYLKYRQVEIFEKYRTPNIPHVIKDFTELFKIKAPSIEEQTQIGNFFQILDKRIEAEAQKLERYQTLKRAMLQRMFV